MDEGDRVGQSAQIRNLAESSHYSHSQGVSSTLNSNFNDSDLAISLLTGELYRKSLLADEVIRIKLQCEYVESRVNIFRQGWARPFFQQDTPV